MDSLAVLRLPHWDLCLPLCQSSVGTGSRQSGHTLPSIRATHRQPHTLILLLQLQTHFWIIVAEKTENITVFCPITAGLILTLLQAKWGQHTHNQRLVLPWWWCSGTISGTHPPALITKQTCIRGDNYLCNNPFSKINYQFSGLIVVPPVIRCKKYDTNNT